MAERRMFAKSIVLSGPFIRLPPKAQLLYFHLGMQADDEGFISAPELAMRASGAKKKELEQLVEAAFLLRFPSQLLVLRHWFLHNNIKKDRFRPTVYQQELEQLALKERVYEMVPQGSPDGSIAEPQIKENETKENEKKENQIREKKISILSQPEREISRIPTLKDVMCYMLESHMHTDAMGFFTHYNNLGWKIDGQLVQDWRKLLRKWEADHAGTP